MYQQKLTFECNIRIIITTSLINVPRVVFVEIQSLPTTNAYYRNKHKEILAHYIEERDFLIVEFDLNVDAYKYTYFKHQTHESRAVLATAALFKALAWVNSFLYYILLCIYVICINGVSFVRERLSF